MTPSLSFQTLPIFCVAGNKVAPNSTELSIGYQPQQQLACEEYNYMQFSETTDINTLISGLNNVVAELDKIVTSGGGSPSISQTNQILAALNVLYQAKASGANWATALASFLGANWPTALASALGTNWATALAKLILLKKLYKPFLN